MKDIYRVETNKDVYPDDDLGLCQSNCGSYTDEYVHWLESKLKNIGDIGTVSKSSKNATAFNDGYIRGCEDTEANYQLNI